uniref:Uncharacterized protein n=1 Tax=Plectus sambesii TaxID=2011161 RepID=A0A914WKA2_9BILA
MMAKNRQEAKAVALATQYITEQQRERLEETAHAMMEATERAAGELPSMAANPYMYSWLKATTRTASGRRAKPFHDDSDASHTYRSTAAGQKPYMALSSGNVAGAPPSSST